MNILGAGHEKDLTLPLKAALHSKGKQCLLQRSRFSYVTVDESMCHFPPFLHQFKRASAVMQVLKYKPSVFLISAI